MASVLVMDMLSTTVANSRHLVLLQNVLCLGQLLLRVLTVSLDVCFDLLVGDELLNL